MACYNCERDHDFYLPDDAFYCHFEAHEMAHENARKLQRETSPGGFVPGASEPEPLRDSFNGMRLSDEPEDSEDLDFIPGGGQKFTV